MTLAGFHTWVHEMQAYRVVVGPGFLAAASPAHTCAHVDEQTKLRQKHRAGNARGTSGKKLDLRRVLLSMRDRRRPAGTIKDARAGFSARVDMVVGGLLRK